MNGEGGAGRRRRTRPSGRHALGSLLVHCTALGLALVAASAGTEAPDFLAYHIELVALPEDENEIVVEAPPALPEPEPEPEPDPIPEPEPEPEPEPAPEPAPPPEREPDPEPEPAPPEPRPETPPPAATPEGGDAVNVRMEGLRRDYPAYYNNIIVQIQRCFRWSGGGAFATEVYFVINEDGTVGDQDILRASGNPAFDFEALGAIECAGQAGRFGPLPDDLPYERLPIRFTFRPSGGATSR